MKLTWKRAALALLILNELRGLCVLIAALPMLKEMLSHV